MARATLFAYMCAVVAEGTVQLRRTSQHGKATATATQANLSPARAEDVHVKEVEAVEGSSFVKALEFEHSLRVCNAFPSGSPLEIYRGKEEKLTEEEPMPYKACRDFKSLLQAGDKLEFHLGDQSAGTFSVTNLPESDGVLFLVIHRHDAMSTAVAFESHIFASLTVPQVAIIDTYKGAAKSTPRIMDGVEGNVTRSEMLRFDSVVAVNQGIYEVELDAADGKVEAKSQLVALQHQSYVVLRAGVEAKEGDSYPQELIVFPSSNPAPLLHSAANRIGAYAVAMVAALVVAAGS